MWRGIAVAVVFVSIGAQAETQRLWVESKRHRVDRERSLISQVAKKAMPAVVSITTEGPPSSEDIANGNNDEQKGLGSGFIIHPDGYILTSEHVIEGAQSIRIKLAAPNGNGEEYDATVVGADEQTDVALLKVDAGKKLPVVPLGSAKDVDVADWVVAIGNPFGLSHSVSVGVISYKGRTDIAPNGRQGYFDFIQTDAAINPGNSGGPILDLNGDVVAIANAVNVSGQGIAFALPIDLAKSVLPELRADGKVKRSWMGVSVQDLTDEMLEAYKIEARKGAVVSEVVPEGPGEKAGLRVGDVIVGMNKKQIDRAYTLRWGVATAGIDQRVQLKVLREGKPFSVSVRLAEMPEPEEPQDKISTATATSGNQHSSASEPRPDDDTQP